MGQINIIAMHWNELLESVPIQINFACWHLKYGENFRGKVKWAQTFLTRSLAGFLQFLLLKENSSWRNISVFWCTPLSTSFWCKMRSCYNGQQRGGLGQNDPLGRQLLVAAKIPTAQIWGGEPELFWNYDQNTKQAFDVHVCSVQWVRKSFGENSRLKQEGKWKDDERPLREKHFFHRESDFPQRDYQDERRKLAIDFFLQNIKMKTYRIWKWIFTQLSILSFPDTQN